MTLLDILTAAGIGLTIGAIAALLTAPTRRRGVGGAGAHNAPTSAPPGWEYRTEYRREYDGRLLYEERFTVLVPKRRAVVKVEQPQRKRLTGGA